MSKTCTLLFAFVIITGLLCKSLAQGTASLPVVLVAFDAELATNNTVHITWTTPQQVTTDCFDIEKSNDGISWQRICRVQSTGTSAKPTTYYSTDQFPLKGINFYRICMRDLSGAYGYTGVRSARLNTFRSTTVYPNPSTDLVTVLLGEMPRADWELTLLNSMGQVMIKRKFSKTTTTIRLPVNNYLNGNYSLEISDGYSRQSKKLMINHN